MLLHILKKFFDVVLNKYNIIKNAKFLTMKGFVCAQS